MRITDEEQFGKEEGMKDITLPSKYISSMPFAAQAFGFSASCWRSSSRYFVAIA
jgi:hypothetical protein